MADRSRRLLIGEGAGIGRALYLAEQMRGELGAAADHAVSAGAADAAPDPAAHMVAAHARAVRLQPLVLLGSDTPFPFRPRPSVIVVPGIPTGIIACMPLLEEWGIASRLATPLDLPGCFEGTVTALADVWLSSLSPLDLAEVEILSSGPASLLEATAHLAQRHGVPHHTSLPDAPTARD